VAAAAASPSIAVLAFADMSPQHDQEYFADGVAEEIRNALAHVEGLEVIGRTSSFSFKGKADDLRTIGEKLGVKNVLEGSLRKDGDAIRVTAELIRVADGTHLWSDRYDRTLAGILELQDEVASAVVEALKVRLLSGARPGSDSVRTAIPEAYQEYLLGRHHLAQYSEDSTRSSVQAFERALRLDPGYAPAWAGLAAALHYRAEDNGTLDEVLKDKRRAVEAANRAVALAPDLADSYVARASTLVERGWDWTGSLEDARRAMELNPRDARAYLVHARLLTAYGRVKEAIPEYLRATELDPLNAEAWAWLWYGYHIDGQPDQALRAIDRAQEISPSNRWASFPERPVTREAALKNLNRDPGNDFFLWMLKIGSHHLLQQDRETREALRVVTERWGHSAAWQIAIWHCKLGDRELAFEWIERAFAQMDSGLSELRIAGKCLAGDPRYAAMLRKVHLPVD
jgi:TolB-like protein/Tfp pilus assembly protein PilF